MDDTRDWYWEGNVVTALRRHLEREGWTVTRMADTRVKERGIDLEATKNGRTLLVEAKGYPSTNYADSRRAGETKPTNPSLQAGHWYSHAVLAGMRLQNKHPEATVALALPDFPRYRALFEETRGGLHKMGIAFLTVRESGEVETCGIQDALYPGAPRKTASCGSTVSSNHL
jgi:hypothetical protein